MATITDYASLTTAIGDWSERTYTQSQVDGFIGLFEARANRILGHNYRREVEKTLNTDANGEVTLPTGFVGMRSIVRDVSGSVPLLPVTWGQLSTLNPYAESGDPVNYAISGSTLKVAPIAGDDFTAVYWSKLTGLNSTDTTNWLITLAPDAYLWGVLAQAYAFEEDPRAMNYREISDAIIDELRVMSDLAQFSNAEVVLDTVTP